LGTVGTGIFNTLHPPFDKPAVRRAVLRAMSQQDFMTAAAGADPTLWRADAGVFTPGTPLATDAGIEAITAPGCRVEPVQRHLHPEPVGEGLQSSHIALAPLLACQQRHRLRRREAEAVAKCPADAVP
jgi:hypothetical protein